jgi:hypothetical protein
MPRCAVFPRVRPFSDFRFGPNCAPDPGNVLCFKQLQCHVWFGVVDLFVCRNEPFSADALQAMAVLVHVQNQAATVTVTVMRIRVTGSPAFM